MQAIYCSVIIHSVPTSITASPSSSSSSVKLLLPKQRYVRPDLSLTSQYTDSVRFARTEPSLLSTRRRSHATGNITSDCLPLAIPLSLEKLSHDSRTSASTSTPKNSSQRSLLLFQDYFLPHVPSKAPACRLQSLLARTEYSHVSLIPSLLSL